MRLPDAVRPLFLVLVLSIAASAQTSAPPKPTSDYFPTDTVAFLEVPSVPALVEGAKGTGLNALWNDDSMAKIRSFVDSKLSDEALPSDDRAALALLWKALLSVKGPLAFGLVPSEDGLDSLLVADVGPDTSAVQALLARVYSDEAASGFPPERINVAGVSVTVSGADGEYSCLIDGRLFLGSKYTVLGALDRRIAPSASGSLSASVNFTRASSFFSAKKTPAYRVVLDFPALSDRLRASLPLNPALNIENILDSLGFGDIETVSAEGSFALSGMVDHVYVSTTSADSVLLDIVGRTSFDQAALSSIPADALLLSAADTDLTSTYKIARDFLGLLGPAAGFSFDALLDTFQKNTGINIERDILPALGTTNISYFTVSAGQLLPALASGAGTESISLFEVSDEAAILASLDKLANYALVNPDFLADIVPPGAPAPALKTTTLGNLKIYHLSMPGLPLLSPALAVSNGYLVYGNNKESVVAAVDRLIASSASILDNPDYTRVRSALANSPSQLTYFNLDRMVDLVYDNLISILAQEIDTAHDAGTVPFTSADIPPAFRVKRHIDGIAMTLSTSGNLIDQEIYSPTGVAPALMLAAGFFVVAETSDRPATPDTDPARTRLADIGSLLQVSTIENKGRFPENLSDTVPVDLLQSPRDPDPKSPVDYVYVPALTVTSPAKTILVYERSGLQPDGRHVLYVDGTVEFVTEGRFHELMGLQPDATTSQDAPAADTKGE